MSATHRNGSQACELRMRSRSATNDSARDVRAADLQEDLVKPVRGLSLACEDGQVSPEPTKTAATNEHRRERSEQSNRAPVREARNTPLREHRSAR